MKRTIRTSIKALLPLVSCFLTLISLTETASGAPYHGGLTIQIPLGPTGIPVVHPGEKLTVGIAVENRDDFGDSLLLTNIVYTTHLGGGSVSSNLLAAPVVLTGPGDFKDVVYQYLVPPTDQDYLIAHARVEGGDNFDGPGRSHVAEGFAHTVPGIVQILRPCITVISHNENNEDDQGENEQGGENGDQDGNGGHGSGGQVTAFNASVKNCGNCPLHNVVVSNQVNGVFLYVLGPTNLDVGQVIAVTVGTTQPGHGEPQAPKLFAWGTDRLGFSVSSSSSSDEGQQGDQGNQGDQGEDGDNQQENTTSPFDTMFAAANAAAIPEPDAAFVYTMASGPGGASQVHPGDKVTVVIGIVNLSDDLGTITVTNVTTGSSAGANLLNQPVTLDSLFGIPSPVFMLEITNSYIVPSGVAGYLSRSARVQGTFNFDGMNGFHVPGGFEFIVGNQIQVQPLAVHMALDSAKSPGGPGIINMRWASVPGKKYQVQYTTDLTQPNWQNLGNPIEATSSALTTSDPLGPDSRRFYRLTLVP